jgi:hypothetical protein
MMKDWVDRIPRLLFSALAVAVLPWGIAMLGNFVSRIVRPTPPLVPGFGWLLENPVVLFAFLVVPALVIISAFRDEKIRRGRETRLFVVSLLSAAGALFENGYVLFRADRNESLNDAILFSWFPGCVVCVSIVIAIVAWRKTVYFCEQEQNADAFGNAA